MFELYKTDKKNLFPQEFLWGGSSSAYQVEGASLIDGKGPSWQDVKEIPEGTSDLTICSDQYHHYKEDIKLMAEMGFKAYRFSISWARILPEGEGEVNQKGVDYYNNLIDECLKYDITPIVTMFHFDLPQKLQDKGGWSNRNSVDWFVNFAEVLFKNYGDRVDYWLTINEQNMLTLVGPVIGTFHVPENCTNVLKELYQQNHHMLVAQAKVMEKCHTILRNSKIGPAPNISLVYPQSSKPEDVISAQNFNAIRNWLYLDVAVKGVYDPIVWSYLKEKNALPDVLESDWNSLKNGKPDYIGFNYYSTDMACWDANYTDEEIKGDQQSLEGIPGLFKGVKNPELPKTQFGWLIDPIGFRATFREIYSRYRLPMLVTENGIGAYDELTNDFKIHDEYRIRYYQDHIEQIKLAIMDGCEIIGYCPWAAIDLISTHEGMKKRYGFIYVDRSEFDLKTLKRYKKDSFYWYKKMIASNGQDLSI